MDGKQLSRTTKMESEASSEETREPRDWNLGIGTLAGLKTGSTGCLWEGVEGTLE